MPNPKHRGRSRKSGLYIALLVLVILVGAGLTWRFAAPDSWSAVFASGEKKEETHAGKVAVLISPLPLNAFTALDPAAFLNPATGEFYVSWISEKAANDAALMRDPSLLRGRVLRRDKAAGLAFSEADFFPKGTQASLTAAIDPGFRGISLNAVEIEGLRSLKRFDRFDLYAVKTKVPTNGQASTGYMTPEARSAATAGNQWATDRLVIAQNAKILEPAPTAKNAKNADEVYAAIRDEEAFVLADARAKGAKIFCLPRSGLPGGDSGSFERPEEPIAVDPIQVITGATSTTTYVPATKPEEPPK